MRQAVTRSVNLTGWGNLPALTCSHIVDSPIGNNPCLAGLPLMLIVLPSLVLLFKGKQKLFGFALVVAYSALWFYLMMKDREEYQSILQFIF